MFSQPIFNQVLFAYRKVIDFYFNFVTSSLTNDIILIILIDSLDFLDIQ